MFAAGDIVPLRASAADPDDAVAVVQFYDGGTLLAAVTNAPYAFDWTNAPAGVHTLVARAFDTVGLSATSSVVIGVSPGGAAGSLAPLPAVAVPASADAWLAAVSPGHPRLREMDAQASSYRLSARSARRMSWPDLELYAAYGKREALEGGMEQEDMFSATVAFMVPIFAGSRERSEGAEMDAMARASDAE